MTFNVRVSTEHDTNRRAQSAIALCARCDWPVVVVAEWDSGLHPSREHSLHQLNGNLTDVPALTVSSIWPKPPKIDAPQHIPEKVLRSFLEAAKGRHTQMWNSACGAYRRCMELALKEFAPDVEAWKLEKRIDKLAAEHRITPALQSWAHELRLDGNEALHDDEDATQELADQMHHLTYFLLTYLYTLPKQVEQAHVRRDEAR